MAACHGGETPSSREGCMGVATAVRRPAISHTPLGTRVFITNGTALLHMDSEISGEHNYQMVDPHSTGGLG